MIAHLDMDAFFASVEQLDNPDLVGKPVIIGGGQRGVVATASYEARVYGIHSAMPVAQARKLCPGGIFIHGRHQRYSEVSRRIMRALAGLSPIVQPASIDEAYLDAGMIIRNYRRPLDLALAIKAVVARASGGLTCSVGIAPVKFLAKICSDANKPDGVCILEADEVDAFLLDLPVEKLPGVGKSMRRSLKSIGIETIAQLRKLSRDFMLARYGKFGAILHDRAYGIDPRPVHMPLPPKSEGVERTLEKNTRDRALLQDLLWQYAQKIAQRLARNGDRGRTITLKIKFADFQQISRSKTLALRTADPAIIFETAKHLFLAEKLPEPVRLIGISVSGFNPRSEQLPLPGISLLRNTSRS